MKKIIILLFLGAVFSTAAIAQTDVKKDEKTLKNTIKDKKEDKHQVGKDLAHLKVKSAIRERKEVRAHRRSIHRQGKHLRRHGIKHPIENAKHKAKVDKDMKN